MIDNRPSLVSPRLWVISLVYKETEGHALNVDTSLLKCTVYQFNNYICVQEEKLMILKFQKVEQKKHQYCCDDY